MKNKMLKVLGAIGLAALIAIPLTVSCAAPEPAPAPVPAPPEVIEWRYHSCHPDTRYTFELEEMWADLVYAATDGQLKVIIYPAGALGYKDSDMLRVCGEQGAVDVCYTWAAYTARDDPILNILHSEMVYTNREDFFKVRPYIQELHKELYPKWNLRWLAGEAELACSMGIAGREPFNTLESMKGKKIRVWSPFAAQTLTKLGIAAEVLPQSDLYLALKTGLFDGSQYEPEALLGYSIQEVTSYWSTLCPMTFEQSIVCNEDAFQALPADVQDGLLKASDAWTRLLTRVSGNIVPDKEEIEIMRQKGMDILPSFSDEDRKLLSEAAIEVWKEMAEKTGPEAVQYQQALLAEYERVRTH